MSKYLYLYQITNLLNGKIYVGVHRTDNLDDGYMGSGTYLRKAQKKYGIENFQKCILEFFETEKDLFTREAEVVNQGFLLREDVYNLVLGGQGPGIDFLREIGKAGGKKAYALGAGFFSEEIKEKRTKAVIARNKTQQGQANTKRFRDLGCLASSTKEACEKRVDTFKRIGHQQGEKNSSYGSMWITNGTENKKVPVDDPIPDGWKKGRRCASWVWINNGSENKKIRRGEVIPDGWKSGCLGTTFWITNGIKNRKHQKGLSIPDGWVRGRTGVH